MKAQETMSCPDSRPYLTLLSLSSAEHERVCVRERERVRVCVHLDRADLLRPRRQPHLHMQT